MLPHMDWNAWDKLVAWTFFKKRPTHYLTIAHTPDKDRVTYILFFSSKEATKRWRTLKEQLSQGDQKKADKVFTL